RETGLDNLCLAGGVALNCVGNGRLLREGPFRQLWIQPAAGDAGGAVGAAQLAWHRQLHRPRTPSKGDGMKGAYLGPELSADEIEAFLKKQGAPYERPTRADLLLAVAKQLADGQVVGWFNGRMEFGPRALGARSILGDPRNPRMQKTLNLKIKYRESFRPFAPSVLREDVADYFELSIDSPYMPLVSDVTRNRRRAVNADAERLVRIDDRIW